MELRRNQVKRSPTKGGRPRSAKADKAILAAATKLTLDKGFAALSMDAIAAEAKVGRMTVYRRWPNKAAIIMAAFVARVDPNTVFVPGKNYLETIRAQMRTMARTFRGKDGTLMRALLAAAQLDPELAAALRDQWTTPRRRMAVTYLEEGIERGFFRPDTSPDAIIDILYGPIYYRLQMGTGPLSDAYVDEIFDHAMRGLQNA
jgi:AcrR family transcriptional regulator